MQSFKKKVKSVIDNGFAPVNEGIANFASPSLEWEKIASERLDICKNCPSFVTEPIPILRVKDSRLPEASKKMCDDCGCTLAYKLRQSLSVCNKWK